MSSPKPSSHITKKLADLADRVKKLEDEVFNGGPPGYGERLKVLADELAALRNNSSNRMAQLDQKIDKVIRIVAELKELGRGGGQPQVGY